MKRKTDFLIEGEQNATVFLVQPKTNSARLWLRKHVSEDATWLGLNLAVEHRYIENLAQGIQDAGLTFKVN